MKTLRTVALALGLTFASLAVPQTAHADATTKVGRCPHWQALVINWASYGITYVFASGYSTITYSMGPTRKIGSRWIWGHNGLGVTTGVWGVGHNEGSVWITCYGGAR